MQPLYLARIEDLGRGDLVKVDCAACHHVALLTPEFLLLNRGMQSEVGIRHELLVKAAAQLAYIEWLPP
jgi:hypothetical protein